MGKIQNCGICGKQELHPLMNFGGQTVCHHFLKSIDEKEDFYRLGLGQCGFCQTVQLIERIPVEVLTPYYHWLKCNEPEDHLDALVDNISRLPGITKDSNIGGISFKDDTTLQRLKNKGFRNVWRADTKKDLKIQNPLAWFESVQANFNGDTAQMILENQGKADIFFARHILEHAYDPHRFLELCKQLVNPEGYIVFEVPDCRRAFEHYDYTVIWEEHTVYFTEETFRNVFALNGFSLVYFERMPYSIEDSYVAVVQVSRTDLLPALVDEDSLKENTVLAEKFTGSYPDKKDRIKAFLENYKQQGKKVALFGAGHVSCVFLNLFEIRDYVEFVIDDNPHMRGLFMPGSRIPVVESKELYEQGVDVCLLTLSASSEKKVIENNQKFIQGGGIFLSVFPGSRWGMEV